jgi:hypothetical protein
VTDERAAREWQAAAAGWRRWEPSIGSLSWPLALRMAAVAEVGPGQRVLDVGCGIGDPTLQVAVLVGDQDDLIKKLYVEPLKKVRKDWPVIDIKDANHLTCIVKPQFREEIAAWLKKN